jgi:hypothetical protein
MAVAVDCHAATCVLAVPDAQRARGAARLEALARLVAASVVLAGIVA